MIRLIFLLLYVLHAQAQSCDNYGVPNASSCACPTGFGGPTCSQSGCGGNIFQGSQRPLASNLTEGGCSCEDGWTGTGCNVCQTANACQAAFSAVGSVSTSPASIQPQTNETMICNTEARVYASSQMTCNVINPTLQAIFPLSSTLNIMRTVQPAFSPIPNVTSFGAANTLYAQLFYDGVEQFFCEADSCTQNLDSTNDGDANWQCSNLNCTCRPGTTFCGGASALNLTTTIDSLKGTLNVNCGAVDQSSKTATCNFLQQTIQQVFGSSGLGLNGCSFGECVRQNVIDSSTGTANTTTSTGSSGESLDGGVIAGLAVVGAFVVLALLLLLLGLRSQRAARKDKTEFTRQKASVGWVDLSYMVSASNSTLASFRIPNKNMNDDKIILDNICGEVLPGQMMAILGPSGAGKTTLVEILAGKSKSGVISGHFSVRSENKTPRVGFVPQQDILPSTLTVFEALLFAARLRLPESVTDQEKRRRVDDLLEKLGIYAIRNTRIGDVSGGKARGISGGEMRRVTIGLELIASPDVLLLDEPTSGLDSVSAARVADVLYAIAHDPLNPIPVIASIHQPSSQLYQKFDRILLLAHGRSIYSGPGAFGPVDYFSTAAQDVVPPYQQGYNVAEYLLEIASDPPVSLFQLQKSTTTPGIVSSNRQQSDSNLLEKDHHRTSGSSEEKEKTELSNVYSAEFWSSPRSGYETTFLTQFEYLCGREWKILKRDKTLFIAHVLVAAILGVFCGGLYFKTGITIAGFQSRVGCLFFLGSLIAFSSLSALYNLVEVRPLFLRERSSSYYSPTAWLLSRFFFDMIPLRLIPTIIVGTITYWMAGLAPDAVHFFKFVLILVLYSLCMTVFNFLLGTFFQNGGIAILLSALSALYQMTFAGFFVHLSDIPPVLRWLQWLCPLKYALEALSVNEVGAGLMIEDTLQGVPVDISASLIMNLLFGFGSNNYYRDVLVLVAYILGFGFGVIVVVWFKVREQR